MATAANADLPSARSERLGSAVRTGALSALVLLVLWALWEGYRFVGQQTGITRPFEVNERTMPHIHDMFGQLFEPARRNGPLLVDVLFHAALFTAKEALAGFVMGASLGF